MRLAFIVPVNRATAPAEPAVLRALRRHGHRVVLVDDGRGTAAERYPDTGIADRIVLAAPGWARQCNAGSRVPEAESADALVFVPEDVRLPQDADRAIARTLANSTSHWGCFGIRYGGSASLHLMLAALLADACTLATGVSLREQATFVTRSAFLALDGFDAGAADADADFARRARTLGPPARAGRRVHVAAPGPWHATLAAVLRRERVRLGLGGALRAAPGD